MRTPERTRTSSGRPTSIGRPSPSSARTRSASGHARSTRCSTRTIDVSPSGLDRGEPGEEVGGPARIQVRGRLVQDEDARAGPRARRRARAAAARRPRAGRSAAARSPRGPTSRERLRHPGEHPAAEPAAVLEAERDVVLDALHDELALGVLEDDPDARRQRGGLPGPGLGPVDLERALECAVEVARHEAGDGERERALAGSGRPDDQQRLPRPHLERDVRQRGSRRTGMAEPEVACADRPGSVVHATVNPGSPGARRTGAASARSAPSRRPR